LKALFEPFGSIKDVNIKTKQGSRNSYVFIDFDTVENATKALTEYIQFHIDSKDNNSKGSH